MLSHLKLQNLILIEKAEIALGDGLNIFTGETGSGKSAILTAIRLISGERADSEWIRAGAAAAIIEAAFTSFSGETPSGIDFPKEGEPFIVRREIHRSGKSRCFIADQLVSASVLRELMRPLLEMVDQSSSVRLCQPETQRQILDAYAGLEDAADRLFALFEEMSAKKKELEAALADGRNRSRDLEWAASSLKEIEEVNWQKEEEEQLTQTHLLLTHVQELGEKLANAACELSGLSPHIRHLARLLEGAAALDRNLLSPAQTIKTASLEFDEAERFLQSYAARLEADPGRLAAIESRIGAIENLKRRFGPSWEEVETKRAGFKAQVERLSSIEDSQATLAANVKELEEKAAFAAKQLSEKRQKAAKAFSQAVLEELRCLNLPNATFAVQLAPKPLSSNGIDEILFLFSANPGLPPLPLDQCASGGELSRLLFATKVAVAEKESVQCLIFDEIDSNVGGQTAVVLGEKIKKLAKVRQVICVTHFVQVARFAAHHFAVAKTELNGRAATFIEPLDPSKREREYARMIGN